MPSVLVVDDQEMDRRIVAEFLKEESDLELRYAENGAQALEQIDEENPDLVLTDLVMPEVDGLELVTECRSRHPMVPVILITSKGNEETAVRALEEGAASYVPKQVFAQRLVSTVRNVLAVSGRQRVQSRLMGCMAKSEYVFDLENDSALIHPLVTYLQERTCYLKVCDESDRTRIGVALEEALVNALYHGNLEIGSELRGEDDRKYYMLIQQRSRQSPYRDRQVHVEVKMSRQHATFVIRDEGPGFDPSSLPDPTDPVNLEKASGRGLLLMRTFMDEVEYNEMGNVVTLTKRRRADTLPNQTKES
ncbi:MAG: response regulator [Planctomycetes bacterium]|nr:response regulator [Planctomycetota bacterium]